MGARRRHRCGPSKQFTPILTDAYNKLRAAGKSFEVVYISSDQSEGAMKDYFSHQPWFAMPFEPRERKEKLSDKYKVREQVAMLRRSERAGSAHQVPGGAVGR